MNLKKYKLLFEILGLFIVLILSLLPVIFTKGIVTLDGSTHVYSSNILGSFLLGKQTYSAFFELNSLFLPNVIGHLIIFIIIKIVGIGSADFVFQILLVTGLVFSFGGLVKRLSGYWYPTILIVPFIYSLFFVFGFYNFLLALIFYFLFITFLLKKDRYELSGIKEWFIIFSFFGAIYFTHFFVFSVACLSVFFLALFKGRDNIIRTFKYFSSVLFFLVLSLIFIVSNSQSSEYTKVFYFKRIYEFFHGSSLVGYHDDEYLFITPIITIVLMLCVPLIKDMNFKKILKSHKVTDILFLLSLTLLLFFVILPNSNGWSGYIADRFGYFSILIFSLLSAISLVRLSKFTKLIVLSVFFLFSIKIAFQVISFSNDNSKKLDQITSLSNSFKSGDIIFPIYGLNASSWIQKHSSLAALHSDELVFVDNYQGFNSYFPVKFKDKFGKILSETEYWDIQEKNIDKILKGIETIHPDYILLIGNDTLLKSNLLLRPIGKKYRRNQSEDFVTIYKAID